MVTIPARQVDFVKLKERVNILQIVDRYARLSGSPSLSSTRITVSGLAPAIAVVNAEPLGDHDGGFPQGHALNVRNQVKLVAAGVAVAEALPSARRCHRKRSLARSTDRTAAGVALSGMFEVLAPTVAVNNLQDIDTLLELHKVHLASRYSTHDKPSVYLLSHGKYTGDYKEVNSTEFK